MAELTIFALHGFRCFEAKLRVSCSGATFPVPCQDNLQLVVEIYSGAARGYPLQTSSYKA